LIDLPFAAELIVFGVAVVVVLPALGLLYVLSQRGNAGRLQPERLPDLLTTPARSDGGRRRQVSYRSPGGVGRTRSRENSELVPPLADR
jgi:hypothetical protein